MSENTNSESNNNRPPVEPDELPLAKLALYLGGVAAVLVLLLLVVWTYYKSSTAELLQEKQVDKVNKVLVEARAKDKALIDAYELIDREKGVYRIPVEQAMELLLSNPMLLMPKEQPKKEDGAAASSQPASLQPATQPSTSQPATPAVKEAK